MTNRIAIRDRAAEIVLGELGTQEVGPNNHGPRIREYLLSVGLTEGNPWCAALVVWAYGLAAAQLGGLRLLPRTGKVVRLWQRCPTLWLARDPSKHAIAIHLNNPDDPNTSGHCGIVYGFTPHHVRTVEGNTSRDPKDDHDDQNGDGVYTRHRPPRYWTGFIDVGREGPSSA